MKKIKLYIIATFIFCSLIFQLKAQTPLTQNFVIKDLNGKSWDFYDLLSQGYTIIFDASATWCGPCWNYHQSHKLRDLYDHYGPTGTIQKGKVMVFLIEVDCGTATSELDSWKAGTTYPIVNLEGAICNTFGSEFKIAGFPTIFMICGDKKWYDIGQPSEQSALNSIKSSCPATVVNYDATTNALDPAMICTNSFAPVVSLANKGNTTLTSCKFTYSVDNGTAALYNWVGSIAAGQVKNVSLSSVAVPGTGSHTLTVTTSAPNGQTDQNTSNDSKTYNFTANLNASQVLPITETFAATTFPSPNWILNNPDKGITWVRSDSVGGFGTSTSSIMYDGWGYGTIGQYDELFLPPIDMAGNINPILEFDVAYSVWAPSNVEQLEVFVSNDCAATWTNLYNKSGATLATTASQTVDFYPTASQWRKESINLSNYTGNNKLFVKLKATNNSGSKLYVDNINVSQNPTGLSNSVIDNTLLIFPNPAKEFIRISYESEPTELLTINIYNKLGQKVSAYTKFNLSAGKQDIKIETSQLSSGVYLIQIITDNYSVSRKIVIN